MSPSLRGEKARKKSTLSVILPANYNDLPDAGESNGFDRFFYSKGEYYFPESDS
jgi:hypothetical protein